MYIKGELGECVLIKAVIEKVEVIGKEEIRYGVKVLDGNSTMNYLDQSDIIFPDNKETADPSGEFEPLPVEYNDDIVPDSASGLKRVLDKIRAEIFTEVINYSGTGEEVIQAYADGLKKGLDIIDKYKPESGAKE